MEARNFYDLTLQDLQLFLAGLGKEKFRAQQLFQWVYQKGVSNFDEMTNLSKTFREELKEKIYFERLPIASHLKSVDGTEKFLFEVGAGKTIEAVLIPNKDRLTLCVSSEVGCNMACRFCFTGKQKLEKRLSIGMIVGQFLGAAETLGEDRRITNIVFMGMGEPLDNADAVFGSVDVLNEPWGINFSRRKVTISTSGLVHHFPRLIESRARLAVSLNATTDEVRDEIMPINKRYPLKTLLEACKDYALKTKDRVTFEYVLLKDVTDSVQDARRLKKILKGIPCKINIIPFNEHPGSDYKRPEPEAVLRFQKELMNLGMHVLLRKTMGRDIYAACGQLRSKFEGHPEKMDVVVQ